MFKNLFFHERNRSVYRGSKECATPVRDAYTLPTQAQATSIDRQEAQIRQLERKAKTDIIARLYRYGY